MLPQREEQRAGWILAPTSLSARSFGAGNNLYDLLWRPWQPCGRLCASYWGQFLLPYSFHSGGEDRQYTSKDMNMIISDNG